MKKGMMTALIVVLAAGLVTACSPKNMGNHNNMPGMNHDEHTESGQASTSQVQATWKVSDHTPQSNKNEEITIQINDKNGKPVQDFQEELTKKMHLIVVSKDLSFFNHIHPNYMGNGMFKVTTQFPTGGDYKLIADFTPADGKATNLGHWITVSGTPSNQSIMPDFKLTKVVDGKEVTLSFDGPVQANKPLMMTFHMTDAATKQPITNLEPYLGVEGHVVILSSDAEKYLHVHPANEKGTGPDATFHTEFPTSGVYKIWGQFQQQGKVFVAPFVVKVP